MNDEADKALAKKLVETERDALEHALTCAQALFAQQLLLSKVSPAEASWLIGGANTLAQAASALAVADFILGKTFTTRGAK